MRLDVCGYGLVAYGKHGLDEGELCGGLAHSQYFDKLEARCHACGDVTARASVLISALLLVVLAALGANAALPL